MKLLLILFDLLTFCVVGIAAFKTYAYLIGKKFKLNRGKMIVCFVAGGIIDSFSKMFQADVMLLTEHLFYSLISAIVFAVLLACLFAAITVKREEAAARKQQKLQRKMRTAPAITMYPAHRWSEETALCRQVS